MLRSARGSEHAAQAAVARRIASIALVGVLASTALSAEQFAFFPHGQPSHPFLSSPRGTVTPRRQDQWSQEESRMRSLRSSALVVGSSLALASGALAQQAVQWRVEDGGNGHWYAVDTTQSGWTAARERALARGGDLASFETAEEHAWLLPSLPVVTHGYLIGGTQGPGSAAPNMGWRWLTGSEISPALMLADDNPCGSFPADVEDGQQDFLHWRSDAVIPYGDINDGGTCFLLLQSITEWSADCNNDGIVDYGQIRSGELGDANGNNTPDCCEAPPLCTPCRADVDRSGAVNGVDLAAILNTWGTDGGKYPGADIDGDGTVNGADLAEVLGAWGECL
jgi:hypothetical protein